MSGIRVIPLIHHSPSIPDLTSLISIHEDTLFLFVDNVLDHNNSRLTITHTSLDDAIRKYNFYGPHKSYPRSAGIVIGWNSWQNFRSLQEKGSNTSLTAKEYMQDSIDEIRALISTFGYKRIMFRARSGEFPGDKPRIMANLSDEIQAYLTEELYSLGE